MINWLIVVAILFACAFVFIGAIAIVDSRGEQARRKRDEEAYRERLRNATPVICRGCGTPSDGLNMPCIICSTQICPACAVDFVLCAECSEGEAA